MAAGAAWGAGTQGVDYRSFPVLGSRVTVWVLAELHLLFAAFVLGVPMFVVVIEIIGAITKDAKYDRLAREFTNLLTLAFSLTATFGAVLLFALIGLYPKVMSYLTGVFAPTMYFYAFLFFGESFCLYLYYYGWDLFRDRKGMHIAVGILLNVFGTILMFTANIWLTFMMSPAGVDLDTGALVNLSEAINNPTWWPINIHRTIANICFGGAIAAAYCAVRFLASDTEQERAQWDWMGYTGNMIAVFALIPLPFAGYWLTREIYKFNAQMGTTLMGGAFSWLFIIQALLIGVLFLGANYYLWLGLMRIPGGRRYLKYVVYLESLILICVAIWMTPHTLVATLAEARKVGAAYHPILGVFGVMSAKNTVVNILILTTFLSFLLYRRANKKTPTGSRAVAGKVAEGVLFAAAAGVVIFYGVYGYFVPASVRIGFSVYQVLAVLTCILVVFVIDMFVFLRAETIGAIRWGQMPARSQYTLILLAVVFVLLMGLMGYVRSGIRLDYHVQGMAIMRDMSPDAFTPTLGFATTVIGIVTTIFLALVSVVFWLAGAAGKKA